MEAQSVQTPARLNFQALLDAFSGETAREFIFHVQIPENSVHAKSFFSCLAKWALHHEALDGKPRVDRAEDRSELITALISWEADKGGRPVQVADLQAFTRDTLKAVEAWADHAGEMMTSIDTSGDGLIDLPELQTFAKQNTYLFRVIIGV